MTAALAAARRASACRAVIAHHSKSFALAATLLPSASRDAASALYAWCRRADDAVDLAPSAAQAACALARLRQELDSVYVGERQGDPVLAAFQSVVQSHGIPRAYPRALLQGLGSDVGPVRYRSRAALLLYCFRVAGTVGLMMCHVLGVRDRRALIRAAHLGIAMQLTNVCRDVREDWQRGRVYLPRELFEARIRAAFPAPHGDAPPPDLAGAFARAVLRLLADAQRFYRSADRGLAHLGVRESFAIRTARLVYSAIGRRLRLEPAAALTERIVVSRLAKLGLLLLAALLTLAHAPRRLLHPFRRAELDRIVRFRDVHDF
jgi:phytoene synthase